MRCLRNQPQDRKTRYTLAVRTYSQEAGAVAENRYLVCRVGGGLCAVPVTTVRETMRPQPVTPLADGPPYLSGVAVVRGALTPVVDAGALVSGIPVNAGRLLSLAAADRSVALAVESVVGVRVIEPDALVDLPDGGPVAGLGVLGDRMLAVLDAVRVVPEPVWDTVLDEVRA
jgi:purine-binding chemotaxis protein CheW